MPDHTTKSAAAYLNERGGFDQEVTPALVHQWCKRDKFPNARSIAGRLWQIPQVDLDAFQPQKSGRPKGKDDRS